MPPLNANEILKEIDAALTAYQQIEERFGVVTGRGRELSSCIEAPQVESAELITFMEETVTRLSPSVGYGRQILKDHYGTKGLRIRALAGVLKALRADYAAGRAYRLQERIRSDVFADFLQMADYLIEDEGLKDPAAIMAGGVLEQHLRKLCEKNKITVNPKDTINPLNVALYKASVYGNIEQQQITAWAAIRNKAAHTEYDQYDAPQVKLMIQGIRQFVASYPA